MSNCSTFLERDVQSLLMLSRCAERIGIFKQFNFHTSTVRGRRRESHSEPSTASSVKIVQFGGNKHDPIYKPRLG